MTRFDRLLIANRGEIVVRVARTARAMGLQTIAVYADADAVSPHVLACDLAIGLGGERPIDSYLNIDKLLWAAQHSGAQAIHPGYGFLSENPDFADAVIAAGLVWVGPTPSAMRAMGDKARSRRHMQDVGVPVLPGSRDASTDLSLLTQQAHELGFPLMVKASAGGGGRGMRLVKEASQLGEALHSASQEALTAFGDGRLLLERALLQPRHVEVQLLADAQGHVIHLGERDCTVQRRHQKLIEEAPSPAVDSVLRRQLGEVAVNVARAVAYTGAGTVEFLLDTDPDARNAFYFMEMNTRLQVEHPVTEALVGEDLVRWQLRLAMGDTLDLSQDTVLQRFENGGHAIEARLCAEDPAQHHMPQTGTLLSWQPPAGLRCDAALESGQTVGPFYDSMLAKLMAHAPTRDQAAFQLADGLSRTVCLGLVNNAHFLAQVLRSPVFLSGAFDTSVLQNALKHLPVTDDASASLAVAAFMVACVPRTLDATPPAAWWHWHSSGHWAMQVPLRVQGEPQHWQMEKNGPSWRVSQGTQVCVIDQTALLGQRHAKDLAYANAPSKGQFHCELNQRPMSFNFAWQGETLWLHSPEGQWVVEDARLQPASTSHPTHHGSLKAPMHGRVVRLLVQAHETVTAGQLLCVMEAMKMEHHLHAPCDGTVSTLLVNEGMQVTRGQLLLQLTP